MFLNVSLPSMWSRNEYFLVKRMMIFVESITDGSCENTNSHQRKFPMVALSKLSLYASFIFLRKKEKTGYVKDNWKLLSRISLRSVHNLVGKQKTFWRTDLVHQGMSSPLNLMFFCSSLGNGILEKVSIWLGKISECAGLGRSSPPMRVRQSRSGTSSGIRFLFLNYLWRV